MNLNLLHPAVVHFPIALLLVGSAAALCYIYVQRRTELLVLTWWLLILGWVGVGAAILTGLLAQSGLPPQADYRSVLNWHIGTGMASLAVYGFLLYRRWLQRPRPAKRHKETESESGATDLLDNTSARLWLTLLIGIGIILVMVSGWSGGQLVYEWGVNVLLP